MRLTAKNVSGADKIGVQTQPVPIADSVVSTNLSKKWSVQLAAATAKDIADTLVGQLKVKGYDGYSMQAEVTRTNLLSRVGRTFDAREKAEAVRQSLARQEGYQGRLSDRRLSRDAKLIPAYYLSLLVPVWQAVQL